MKSFRNYGRTYTFYNIYIFTLYWKFSFFFLLDDTVLSRILDECRASLILLFYWNGRELLFEQFALTQHECSRILRLFDTYANKYTLEMKLFCFELWVYIICLEIEWGNDSYFWFLYFFAEKNATKNWQNKNSIMDILNLILKFNVILDYCF